MATQTTTTTKTPPASTNGAYLPLEYDPEYDPKYLAVAYPPNEEPMADPIRLQSHLLAILVPLVALFKKIEGALVFSNVFLYYRDGDDTKAVAPDLMVALDIDEDRLSDAKSYHIWAAGKPPELVMEIGSDSTANRDLTTKREIYAQIGVPQYWLFDPPNGSRYGFILKGLRLVNGRYEEIPMTEGPGDAIRGYSEVLSLDICWENGSIRFYDPADGEYLNNLEDHIAAVSALAEAEAENRRLRAQLDNRRNAQ